MIWLIFLMHFYRPPSYQPARRPAYVCPGRIPTAVLCHV